MNPRLLPLFAIAVAAVIGACKGGSDPTGPDSLFTEVIITPSTGAVAAGSTLQLSAAVSGPPGTPQGVMWRSVDTALASVSQTGLVTGKSGGTARIRAKWAEDSTNFTDAHILVTEGPIVEEGRRGKAGIGRR
jgi:hypothetical protein